MHNLRYVLIGSIMLLSACTKRLSNQGTEKSLELFKSSKAQMLEWQARLEDDIPQPLQSTALERYFYAQDGAVTLGYDVRGYVRDYQIFYEQGLERSGWRKEAVVTAPFETLMLYDKPERFCVISLRHASADGSVPIRIMIYTGAKSELGD